MAIFEKIKEVPFVEKCMEEFAHDFGWLYGDPKKMGYWEPNVWKEPPPFPRLKIKEWVKRRFEEAYATGEEASRKKVRQAMVDFINKN